MNLSCKYCGAPIDADDLFCTNCGKKIEENFNSYFQKKESTPTEQVPPSPQKPSSEQSPSSEQESQPREGDVLQQSSKNEPLTFGKCIFSLLLLLIPFVNIICLFVWAFSRNSNTNAKNIARTLLLALVIATALFILGIAQFFFQFTTFTNSPSHTIEEESPSMPWDHLELPFDVSEL